MNGIKASGRRHRRAAALVFVLLALVVVTAATMLLVRSSADLGSHRREAAGIVEATALVQAAEPAILDWLERESARIVLPPDAARPCLAIMSDQWVENGRSYSIVISAWDQRGMIPAARISSSMTLRSALPDSLTEAVGRAQVDWERLDGLDRLCTSTDDGPSIDPFPVPPAVEPLNEETSPADGSKAKPESPEFLHIGDLVSTHSPRGTFINVNTAPRDLLEAAMRDAGRGGVEAILAARAKGRLTRPGAPNGGAKEKDDPAAIRFVGSSDAWSFRIDATSGPVTRSWWCVYARSERTEPRRTAAKREARNAEEWECVQRLAIR